MKDIFDQSEYPEEEESKLHKDKEIEVSKIKSVNNITQHKEKSEGSNKSVFNTKVNETATEKQVYINSLNVM